MCFVITFRKNHFFKAIRYEMSMIFEIKLIKYNVYDFVKDICLHTQR